MTKSRRAFLRAIGNGIAGSLATPYLITSKAKAREVDVDVLVVGSGFCGVAIAQKLAASGARIALLESGGVYPSNDAQYQNRVGGTPRELATQLSIATQRCVGGTSTLWNSSCPLPEPQDFKSYTNFGYGVDWPIGYDELKPYLSLAANWLEVGIPSRFSGYFSQATYSSPFPISDRQREALQRLSGLTDFFPASMGTTRDGDHSSFRVAPTALDLPRKFPKVELFLNTHVSQVLFSGNRADGVVAHTSQGTERRINARHIVLACGGTQNARLLQLTASATPNSPLDRTAHLFGRHLMDHPYQHIVGRPNKAAMKLFTKQTWLHVYDGYLTQKRKGLGANVVRIGYIPPSTYSQFIGGTSESPLLILDSMWEQEAQFENSIKLSNHSNDSFGNPYPTVKSELSSLDLQTISESQPHLANLANVLCDSWKKYRIGLSAHHIMGTTPFSSPQRDGVLNPDGGVIGTVNLWIAGSSSFPSGLGVNPTLIATALSLRLADRIITS